MPEINRFLQLSTAHLSEKSVSWLNEPPPANGYALQAGAEHANVSENIGGRYYVDLNVDRGGNHHRWLEGGGEWLWVIPHRYGWWIWVDDDLPDEHEGGPPADLRAIIHWAATCNLTWLMFDRDTATVETFPIFDPEEAALRREQELHALYEDQIARDGR